MYIYYTDGSCSNNPGKGGYAWIRIGRDYEEFVEESSGGYEPSTTNNRMELMGILSALSNWMEKEDSKMFRAPVTIYTDSAYIHNCYIQKWYKNWENNGWVNSKKELVANKDLWIKLIPFFENPSVFIKKVSGHTGNRDWNDVVDRLAVSYRSEII